MKSKVLKYLTILFIIVGLGIFLLPSNSKEVYKPDTSVKLNEELNNNLSEIEGLVSMDDEIEKYLKHWKIQGATLAISRNDSLVYAKGYGWADNGIRMEPGNLLRIASISKLVTAVGIMNLQDHGLISLSDKVFGEDGILNDSIYTDQIRDKNYYKITVEQLLRHTAGFSTGAGDPMFNTRDIISRFDLDHAPGSEELVSLMLRYRLTYQPGTRPTYSNLGYLILSLIIEKITEMPYETYICENILKPAGIYDMHIGSNSYDGKYPNEVRYYMHEGSELIEEHNRSGRMVEKCYGGNNVTGLQGAGAWIASAPELSRLIATINNYDGIEDIISEESISEMIKFISPEQYGLGWNDITADGIWTRTGSFSGTTAIIKRYPDNEVWILITNTSTYRGYYFSKYTSKVFTRLRESYSKLLPKKDLF